MLWLAEKPRILGTAASDGSKKALVKNVARRCKKMYGRSNGLSKRKGPGKTPRPE